MDRSRCRLVSLKKKIRVNRCSCGAYYSLIFMGRFICQSYTSVTKACSVREWKMRDTFDKNYLLDQTIPSWILCPRSQMETGEGPAKGLGTPGRRCPTALISW